MYVPLACRQSFSKERPRSDRAVGPRHLVHQHRLSRARSADDGEVVVAEVVVEEVQRHQLAAPAAEDQDRRARAAPLADQRREVDGVGQGLARDAAHLREVPVEALGQRHRQARQQCLAMHVRVGVELEAAPAPDGVGRLVRRYRALGRREDGELVVQAHQAAAGVDGFGGGRPVLQFLADVRHDVGHLAPGVLCRTHMVGGDDGLRDVGVEHVHAHRQQEGRAVLQRRLHEVADERAHLPKREALGERLDGVEARFQGIGRAFLPQGQPTGMRILDGVEVDDLVADLPAVVVVQVRRVGLRDAVGVGEQRAPVDQIGGIADLARQRCRPQRGRHRLAQQQHAVALVHVRGVAGDADADHQPEVADRVVEAGGERLLRAAEQMGRALPGESPVEVVIARGTPPAMGLLGLVHVFDAEVRVAAQLLMNVRRAEEVELQTGSGRAVRIERDQDLGHALVGPRLGHHFQHEAQAVAVHEEAFRCEIGGVGQPGGELLRGRVGLPTEQEVARSFPVGARGPADAGVHLRRLQSVVWGEMGRGTCLDCWAASSGVLGPLRESLAAGVPSPRDGGLMGAKLSRMRPWMWSTRHRPASTCT
jgi:hypothetical protein